MEITRTDYDRTGESGCVTGRIVSSLASLASNQQNGINVNLDNSDVTRLQILRNQAYDNGLNGILVTSVDSDHEEVHFIGNTVTGSLGGDGIQLALDNSNITTVLNFENNLVGGSFANGINLQAINASTIADMQVTGNLLGGGGGGGGGTGLDDTLPVIRNGFNSSNLPANDDNSTGLTALGFGVNFFGTTYNSAYLNNNGNITFNAPLFTYTPFSLLSTNTPIIAPFFADVDTRGGSQLMEYGSGTVGGRNAFGVTWDGVRFFQATNPANATTENQFQLVLVDRSDIAPGDFDFEFNYEQILWESGQASGSDANGLGGSSARVGYSNGINTAFELPGSAVNGAFLDSGPSATSLIQNSMNSAHPGRYVFFARGGNIGQVTSNGGDGFNIDLDGLSNINTTNFESNTITSNGVHGIDINVTSGNLGPILLTGNTIADHAGGDGINIIQPNDTDGLLDVTLVGNTITGNTGGRGINIELPNAAQLATTLNLSFTNDAISGNGQEGVRLDLTGNTNNLVNNVTANVTVNSSLTDPNAFSGATGSRFNNNGGIGLYINSDENSDYSLTIGGTGTQNQFNGNGGAGVGIDMEDASTGVITAQNATFNNNLAGSTPGFAGSGFAINMIGASQLTSGYFGSAALPRNTEFSGNASNGLRLNTNTFAVANDIRVRNSTATGNTGDGLNFNRSGDSAITNVLITTNILTNNSDGIDISARGADTADNYLITNNTISTNSNRGVSLFLEADADLLVDFTSNIINNNGGDGIQMRQNGGVTDTPTVRGDIMANTITGNGGDGIDIGASHQYDIGDGTLGNRNTVSNNGGNGILISGASDSLFSTDTIISNTINDNGQNGIFINSVAFNNVIIDSNTILRSGEDGVRLDSTGAQLNATLQSNLIRFSGGDGVQIRAVNSGRAGLGFNNVQLLDNDILDSGRRGVNILNAGTVGTNVFLGDGTLGNQNAIERSQLEGVYVVNTASTTQNADANANTAMDATGAWDTDPRLVLNMNRNFISANGAVADPAQVFDTTGLVIRVGTSDGNNSYTEAGGFADTRGGVIASVTNNLFQGQYGADVTFQSFVSTVNPATTGGTWTDQNEATRNNANDVYNPTGFQQDPLARLDLLFEGNTGEGLIATRTGASYNNDEPIFKSRTAAQDNATDAGPPDDNGPFLSGSRVRNAQRQAGRFGLPPSLTINGAGGNSDNFLYSGVGRSTFRVDLGIGNTFTTINTNFLLDNGAYANPATDSNGLPGTSPNGGPFGIDNMPWGWTGFVFP